MGDEPERVELTSVEVLRAWLAEHHGDRTSALLVRWKKDKGPHVPWAQMVRELLCWGWIDSTARPIDDSRSAQLVTPRRPASGWSRINKAHVVELVADGRMQPPGQAAIDRARDNGSWSALDEVEEMASTATEPDDLRAALDAVPAARAAWDTFPRSAKRVVLQWVLTAKRPETRAKRVRIAVEEAAEGRRANQPRR
ncbi:MAG: YdeI/OmpD-associated family protein [Nocardioidaceae bacterium]